MSKSRAKIIWIDKELGGRTPPPVGTRYAPIIIFPNMEGTWSADFICSVVNNQEMEVEIGFLSKDAPNDLLKQGNKFELFEGRRKVAKGIVL